MLYSFSMPSGVPALLQVLRQVARLEALVLVTGEEAAAEDVAAVPWNHVQPDAAAGDISAGAGGGVDHLLRHRTIEVVLHRAVAIEPVHQ